MISVVKDYLDSILTNRFKKIETIITIEKIYKLCQIRGNIYSNGEILLVLKFWSKT